MKVFQVPKSRFKEKISFFNRSKKRESLSTIHAVYIIESSKKSTSHTSLVTGSVVSCVSKTLSISR